VLEAVKVGGGYGAVVVERLVLRLDEDKLHQDIDHRADDYHYELEVADARHLKPDRRRVGVGARPHQEQAGVAEQLPHADVDEEDTRRDAPRACLWLAAPLCAQVLRGCFKKGGKV
jgi:hypothetical protein